MRLKAMVHVDGPMALGWQHTRSRAKIHQARPSAPGTDVEPEPKHGKVAEGNVVCSMKIIHEPPAEQRGSAPFS